MRGILLLGAKKSVGFCKIFIPAKGLKRTAELGLMLEFAEVEVNSFTCSQPED